jgi:hypothetical protein
MSFAILWAGSVVISTLPYDDVPSGIWRLSEVVIILLLFPLGALSGAYVTTGPMSLSVLLWYLGLMATNLFILGYCSAALIKFLRKIFLSFAPVEPDPYTCNNPRKPKTEQAGTCDAEEAV